MRSTEPNSEPNNGYSNYLKAGLEAVESSSRIILSYYQQQLQEEEKDDSSPVTIADREAEQTIIGSLSAKFPDHGFMGEEFGRKNPAAEYTWIVDPIDGTRYFVHGLPYFTTELALMHQGEIIVGISHFPATGEAMTAVKGQGAWKNQTEKLRVSSATNMKKAILSSGSIKYFDSLNLLESLSKLNQKVSMLRGLEEGRASHLLAEGLIDGLLMPKGYIWDFAAICLIIQEAGGIVTDFSGKKLNLTSDQPMSMLACNPKLHQQILPYLSKTKVVQNQSDEDQS
jgi:histidinol-phosphatase